MDRLIYTAYSGMSGSMVRQRVIASNMANAQTTGFRAEMLNALPVTLKGPSLEARAMTEGEVRGASMKQGTIIETGNQLDIALEGKVMLSVQAENGDEAYTRRGDLSIDPTGLLVNGDGRPVVGDGGPVTVPLGSRVSIGPDGSVLVADPATPDTPPQQVARLKLASFEGSQIEKGLDGLFRVVGGGVLPADEEAKVRAGALEQSNVDVSTELTAMIESQSVYTANSKVFTTGNEMLDTLMSLKR